VKQLLGICLQFSCNTNCH